MPNIRNSGYVVTRGKKAILLMGVEPANNSDCYRLFYVVITVFENL